MTDDGVDPKLDSATRARFITRWVGTGIGAALLVTVLALAFAPDCVSQTQAHVLAVCLALGAAIILWGLVGGLKVDLKLKFKALGEVAAGGVAAIFLIVHFVATDGIIVPEGCVDGKIQEQEEGTAVLYGRVYMSGSEADAVAHANVKVEMQEIETRVTNEDGEFDIIVRGDIDRIRVWVEKDGYYTSVPVDETVPLGSRDKLRIPMVQLLVLPDGHQADPPPVKEFPTFVEEWDEEPAIATIKEYKAALRKYAGNARMLVNWARRAHAAGDHDWALRFFEAAQKADPRGKVWFSDQAYLGSVYEKLGRYDEAKALQEKVEAAVRDRDPRMDPLWYGVTVEELGVTRWSGLDKLPPRGLPSADPKLPGTGPKSPFEPGSPLDPRNPTGQPRLPTAEPVQPTAEPRLPTAEPVQPTAQPRDPVAQPVQPTAQPQPTQPTAQPVQPTAEPVQPKTQPTTQPVQPKTQPTTQPVQPTTQPRLPTAEPVQPTTTFPRGTVQPSIPRTPIQPIPK